MTEKPAQPKWVTDNQRIADELFLAIDNDLDLPAEAIASRIHRNVLAARVREGSINSAVAVAKHIKFLKES